MFYQRPVRILRCKLIEHAQAPGVVTIRCQAHRLSLAVAVPPAESLGNVAIEAAHRGGSWECLQTFDAPVLSAPQADRDSIACTINSRDQLLIPYAARVVGGSRVCEMMLHM